ncbi:MAG: polysaccharide deacetylase family protein [Spirochaetia bacterium]|nr:polysaccharide deacetylase family protein [Spirochaetia bacterium]
MKNGIFVISLDFEMLWGMRDHVDIEAARLRNIQQVPEVITKLLKLFETYHIHATWATVGMLMAENTDKLHNYLPTQQPTYENQKFNSYTYLEEVNNYSQYYFPKGILETIHNTPGQEIASHTFSHFYCCEAGQTEEQFKADLAQAVAVAEGKGYGHHSLVLPRNQVNISYLSAMQDAGFTSFRGCCDGWAYDASQNRNNLARAIKLIDTYFPLTGNHTYASLEQKEGYPVNLKASWFFRMYSRKLKCFEGLKIRRIKRQMLHAARHGEIFHLWWHPHNVAVHPEESLRLIEAILSYYEVLNTSYGFTSLNMEETTEMFLMKT